MRTDSSATGGPSAGPQPRRRFGGLRLGYWPLALAIAVVTGCTAIPPASPPGSHALPTTRDFHADLHEVLQRFVDDDGLVDYPALAADRTALDRYYALVAAVSPETHPAQFPTEHDRLAYWLNAYNAAVLTAVLQYYPIASVRDVRPPTALFFLPRLSGFFLFQRITLGGRTMSLLHLENDIVRARFGEPRIHFALNCASASCPRLPRTAFTGASLEAELEREARRFMADARNVRIDLATRRIELSPIFDWYEDDYLDWLAVHAPDAPHTLSAYVARYAPATQAAALRACADCTVTFAPYDWSLNDRSAR